MKTINGITFHSVAEVAERLGVNVQTVRNMINGGRLEASRIGRSYYVNDRALNTYLGITAELLASK